MSSQKEPIDNPYRAPTSDLDEGFIDSQGWSSSAVKNAKRHFRCIYLGSLLALYGTILTIGVTDILLSGWEGSIGEITIPALIALPVVLLISIPFGTLYVDYKKGRCSTKNFVTSKQKELNRWYNKPIVHTFAIWIGSCVLLLTEAFTSNPFEVDFRSLAMNSGALLAFPVVMPIIYLVMKSTLQRARNLLEQMSQEL